MQSRAFADEASFQPLTASAAELRDEEREAIVNEARYSGYLEKQAREAARNRDDEELLIPPQFSYRPGLSRELSDKLDFVRPVSIGQAGRIRGMTPAAISILRMHVRALERTRHRSDDRTAEIPRAAPELEREGESSRS